MSSRLARIVGLCGEGYDGDVSDEKPITGVRRAERLDALRSAQRRERAALTPAERLARADEMLALARSLHGGLPRRDNSAEVLLRVRASFRERVGR